RHTDFLDRHTLDRSIYKRRSAVTIRRCFILRVAWAISADIAPPIVGISASQTTPNPYLATSARIVSAVNDERSGSPIRRTTGRMSRSISAGLWYITIRRLPAADLRLMMASVASISAGVRYMTTPSQSHVVASVGS